MKHFFTLLALVFSQLLFAQTLCEDGSAGDFACGQIDLMAYLSLEELQAGQNVNDVWGWTDAQSGREFVLCGTYAGTSFIEITDPVNPVFIGHLPTSTVGSLWRDVKTYGNYALIVSEAGGHGMQVFDLTQLLDAVDLPLEFAADALYTLFGKAHNIVVNEETGFAYSVGSNTFSGGLHIINMQDPLNPVIAGGFDLDGYTHDAQAVVYSGPDTDYLGKEIVFACNNDAITIVDAEDKSDCQLISTRTYENLGYVHQGWLTPDQRYFLMGDELDELDFGHNTRTYIWDCLDLDDPVLIGFYESSEAAVDHNLYTLDNFVYQSNYRAGLRVLDASDVGNGNLYEVAYFDVFTESNDAGFSGNWSNYPYFSSGNIPLTSMYDGLYIVKPNFYSLNAVGGTEFCGRDTLQIEVDVKIPIPGSLSVSVSGLAGGVNVEGNLDQAPGTLLATLSGLQFLEEGQYDFQLILENGNAQYPLDFSFTIDGSAPGFFELSLPLDDAGLIFNDGVEFAWESAEGASSYVLTVYQDVPFSGDVVHQVESDTNSYSFTAEEWGAEGLFFWVVEAVNECGVIQSTGVFNFQGMYVGVEEYAQSDMLVYPNPSNDFVFVKHSFERTELMRIFSASGVLVHEEMVQPGVIIQLDHADFASGTYFIQLGSSVGKLHWY